MDLDDIPRLATRTATLWNVVEDLAAAVDDAIDVFVRADDESWFDLLEDLRRLRDRVSRITLEVRPKKRS